MVYLAVFASVILAVCASQSTASFLPTCSPPVAPENGYFRPVKSHYPIGWKIVFLCNNGFELSGHSVSVCKLSFKFWKAFTVWSFPSPVCRPVARKCSDLSAPQNGRIRVSGTKPGDRADYSCNNRFVLNGVGWRKCQDDGQWTGEAPTCERVQCPALISPANGKVRMRGRHPGNRADYSCNDGFKLKGVGWRKCQDNGHWTGEAPICEKIIVLCPVLRDPKNGKVRVGGRNPGNRADYSCNDGFVLNGVGWRKCQDNGKWTGEAPICERVQCPVLIAPTNGKVRVGGRHLGNRADYSCNDGFKLKGVGWRKCQDNGHWTGEAPTCEKIIILCPVIRNPQNGKVRVGGRSPGNRADYSCNDGFVLNGMGWRKCQDNGKWIGEAPTCERVQCPVLIAPASGKVRVGGRHPGNRADYSCNDGFKLKGVGWRKCQDNGQWTRKAPTCERIQCSTLRAPRYGKVRMGGRYPGDRADYSCNDGFVLNGVGWRKCQNNGDWTGEAPTCEPKACPTLPEIQNGWVKIIKKTLIQVAKYSCAKGFRLRGVSFRVCKGGVWNKGSPKCVATIIIR